MSPKGVVDGKTVNIPLPTIIVLVMGGRIGLGELTDGNVSLRL